MKIKELSRSIYVLSLWHLAIIHAVFVVWGVVTDVPEFSVLSVVFFMLVVPAGKASQIVFNDVAPILMRIKNWPGLMSTLYLLVAISCLVGGALTTALVSAVKDRNMFLALWCYLPFTVIATSLAIHRTRKTIKTMHQHASTTKSTDHF